MDRRTFLRTAGAGAALVAAGRPAPALAARSPVCDAPPALRGPLLTDPVSRSLAADDYGHIVSRTPRAVLRPATVDDVAALVAHADRCGLRVSPRGQGHSSYGQSQVQDGVVVDLSTLARVLDIQPDRMTVEAGATWRQVYAAASAVNATPPVVTDYTELSIGGTLSLGGLSGASVHHGAQVDNVLSLDVVTGTGQLLHCSSTERPELFDAALAGLGQCALVVRATIRLVPLPAAALWASLSYSDLSTCLGDLALLTHDGRFDQLGARALWEGSGWSYRLDAAFFFSPPQVPDHARLLSGLRDDRARAQVVTISHSAWTFRLDPVIAQRRADGSYQRPHVWFLGLLPESAASTVLPLLFGRLTDADVGGGAVGISALLTSRLTRPLLRVPDDDLCVGLLLSRQARTRAEVDAFLSANRALYDEFVGVGGVRYPTDAIPALDQRDFRRHYGSSWGFLQAAKRTYDPHNVLGAGHGIFR